MPEDVVVSRYRLSSQAIHELYDDMRVDLDPATTRSHAIPGMTKLLAAPHFTASGFFQTTVGVVGGMSQSTFSCCLDQVIEAVIAHIHRYRYFPPNRQGLMDLKRAFYALAHFPNVIGAIDCTHVAIIPSREREAAYCNRKLFYSLNVQMICDAGMHILDAVARCPGGTHDSFLLRQSGLFDDFEAGLYGDAWLHQQLASIMVKVEIIPSPVPNEPKSVLPELLSHPCIENPELDLPLCSRMWNSEHF
ncbi:putative nuclease HARBI1 [Rhinatrema bivittatum]|uniref:putative nuclease HARBI1 n=1 Tax=Rhinatrema bivittatum TaxID=194408 RepID=UPI00112CBE32|nr:putative nuclease HARBI1 [Rhinatrema bivittatum]